MPIPHYDAQQTLGFVVSQTSIIEPQVYQTRYPDLNYAEWVQPDFSGNPFARTVTYYSADTFGKAGWINGNSDDVPRAGTERSQFETKIHMAGIGYGWGYDELGLAQMLGQNLQADDAMAARRAYEEFVYRVTLFGEASKGFNGLFNYPGITEVALPHTGAWGTLTGAQIVANLRALMMNIWTQTNTGAMADAIALPYDQYWIAASTTMANTDETALNFFLRTNPLTMETGRVPLVRGMRGLSTLGESGGGRIVAYRRAPEVAKLHIPMPLRFLPAYQSGPLRWDVPGVFRLGGVDVRLPKEMVYATANP